MTIRLDDELAEACKQEAAASGQSLNGWVVMVLRTRTDPEFSAPGIERVRERFRRAGILAEGPPSTKTRPPEEVLARARAAAGRGTPLSEYVSRDRDSRERAILGLPDEDE